MKGNPFFLRELELLLLFHIISIHWISDMSSQHGPMYGRRLLPCVLDELVEMKPQKLYGSIPGSVDIADGIHNITILHRYNVTNIEI